MKKFAIAVVILSPLCLAAQSQWSGLRGSASLWAGAEYSTFNPDYYCPGDSPFSCGARQVMGPTALIDFNMSSRFGAEGEGRWMEWHGYGAQTISNYLIGPRYRVNTRSPLNLWVKLMLGGGWIQTPFYPKVNTEKGSYFAYAPGATLQYRLSSRFVARADYEYQIWPSFDGVPTHSSTGALILHDNGLAPNGFSIGFAYRFLGY